MPAADAATAPDAPPINTRPNQGTPAHHANSTPAAVPIDHAGADPLRTSRPIDTTAGTARGHALREK